MVINVLFGQNFGKRDIIYPARWRQRSDVEQTKFQNPMQLGNQIVGSISTVAFVVVSMGFMFKAIG